MSPARRTVERSERRELLRKILDLPEGERLKVFSDLRDYLGAELGSPDEAEEVILNRAKALADLERATEELRAGGDLDPHEAPTVKQYAQTAKVLGLSTSAASLTRAFGLWRNAQAAVLGEDVPEGPAARRIRAKRSARKKETIGLIDGVKEWLESDPDGSARADYDAFVAEENRRLGRKAYSKSDSVCATLGITWSEALSIGRGETDLRRARAKRLGKAVAGLSDEDFIGSGIAALIIGITNQEFHEEAKKETFPVPVVDLPGVRGWVLGDVKSYSVGSTWPRRKRGSANDRLLLSGDVAERLKIHPDYLRTCISKKQWKRVPEPDGRIGQAHFWKRNRVDKWITRSNAKA